LSAKPGRNPHKFDPARAKVLGRPELQKFLPDDRILDLLRLEGSETVVDYGAGSGILTLPLARRLPRGIVHAVDESPEMVRLLTENLSGACRPPNVAAHTIEGNRVPLQDGVVDRVLAVNLLHEVLGEGTLGEMRRLLAPDGFLLVADWRGTWSGNSVPHGGRRSRPRKGGRCCMRRASTRSA
jgi:SAM-dependent methyltransferase